MGVPEGRGYEGVEVSMPGVIATRSSAFVIVRRGHDAGLLDDRVVCEDWCVCGDAQGDGVGGPSVDVDEVAVGAGD